jgi:opacity protein-like surface antigen
MKNTISVALLASTFAVSALAGSHAAVKESGFYAVGGFGYGSIRETPAASFDTRADIAYALSVGYQINKVLGVEAGYMVFPSVRGLASPVGGYTRTNTSAITLLGRYTHALSSEFDLTAGAGVSVMSREEGQCSGGYCDDPFDRAADFQQVIPTFSLGANYHVNNKVSLGVEGRMTTRAALYPETYTGLVNLSYRLGA